MPAVFLNEFDYNAPVEDSLLQTKLIVPPLRPSLVLRPRLIDKCNSGLDGKLTLVSTGAGFGKTTLVSSWLDQSGQPATWLSLDKDDNDPTRFWAYFLTALRVAFDNSGNDFLAALQSPQSPPIEAILTRVINQATGLARQIVLVLDDYHMVENQDIHRAIAFLLDHLPQQLHLVIVSRSDPPLNLARLRGQGQLSELREADLRFTVEETKIFFQKWPSLHLSADSVAALHRRTEGWAAGLQLASLAMRGYEDTAEFVRVFAGDHSYVIDYLTEEVFKQQPEQVRTFLLETSILNRLTGPLCDAILIANADQHVNGREMLKQLSQRNLFLVPLDGRRRWYRYHHLFADLLHYRLTRTYPTLVPDLHLRASAWFAENGFIADGLHHALAAGDFGRAADLIESVTRPMIGRGEARTVQAWIEALPESLLQQRPLLCVSLAWVYNLNQAGQDIEPLLQKAENALDSRILNQETVADARGNIAILRGYSALQQNNPQLALQHMEESLGILPEDDVYLRSLVSFTQGVIYKRGGAWQPAAEKLKQAADYGRASGNLTVAIGNRVHLIEMLIAQGQLKGAASFCEETLSYHLADQSSDPVPYLGFVYSKLGEILYEWNDLDTASHNLEHGLALADQLMVDWSWTRDGLVFLARLRQLHGDSRVAQEYLERAIVMSAEMQDHFDRIDLSYWQARLWLMQNNLAAAVRWARKYQANTETHTEVADITLARVLLAQGKPSQALDILKPTGEAAGAAGRAYAKIETLVLQALAHQVLADSSQAQAVLALALSLAEPEGFVRVFVDEGPQMAVLLRQLAGRPDPTPEGDFLYSQEYIPRLLAAFPVVGVPALRSETERDVLKEREIQVLRLIAAGLKTPEIAEELHLSNNTIKWYRRNLYSKLGAHSTAEAIEKGHQAGLLQ